MPKKMTWIFIKYLLKKKSSLSHHIMEKKKKEREKNIHTLSPTTHPTSPKKEFLKKPKNKPQPSTSKKNQTSLSHAIQESCLGIVPIPQKKVSFPNPPKETPLKRSVITPSSPHPKKSLKR